MPSITGNKIIFDKDDWLAGMHSRYNSSPADTPLLEGRKLSYAESFNPYRNFGVASPGYLPTSVTNASAVTGSAMRKIIMAAETETYYGYGINSGALLFQIATSGTVTSNVTWPHSITAASGAESGWDVVSYSAKVGGTRAMRVFYSYSNASATNTDPQWNVGMYQLDGSTFDDDFMTTAPATPLNSVANPASTTAVGAAYNPHPMIVGDDDILYIGDGNYVHGYDGANSADNEGKFFAQVLTLPASFVITGFAKYQQNLCIVGYFRLTTPAVTSSFSAGAANRTEARAYFWDYLSNDPWDSKTLNDNYCSGAFEFKGTVGCFTQGRKMTPTGPQISKLLLFDGSNFEPVATFDTNAPENGCVEVLGDTISFVSQGEIYMYGSPYPTEAQTGLLRVGEGNGSSSGGICTLSQTVTVVSTGTGTSGGLDTVNSGFTTGAVTTGAATPTFGEGKKGKVKSVKVYFAAASSATGAQNFDLYLISDLAAQTQVVSDVTAVTAATQVITAYGTVSGAAMPSFTNLGLVLQWEGGAGTNAAQVSRVEVEFEQIGINHVGT